MESGAAGATPHPPYAAQLTFVNRGPPDNLRAAMGVLLTLITGLVLWIVLWAIGVKSIDAFLITLVMLLVAAAAHIIWPTLPGNRDRDRRPS